jgi:WhiB family redox-sensing transcriptional regulator
MFAQHTEYDNTQNWEPGEDELLGLNEERPWAILSACREADPMVFFPGPDGDASEALKYCNACAVREQCLDYALEARERYGVWGGTTEKQRKRLFRQAG